MLTTQLIAIVINSGSSLYRCLQKERDADIQLYYPDNTFYPTNRATPSTIDFLLTKENINPSDPVT